MFKTHLTINKETLVSISIMVGLILLLAFNLLSLVPELLTAYTENGSQNIEEPIDVETLNEALKLLDN